MRKNVNSDSKLERGGNESFGCSITAEESGHLHLQANHIDVSLCD